MVLVEEGVQAKQEERAALDQEEVMADGAMEAPPRIAYVPSVAL